SQVNKIFPSLPSGTLFEVERMDPTVFPVIAYSLTSDSHSLIELRDLALYTLRPALSTVSRVARVSVQGGRVEEYRVTVDPDKLQSFKMTLPKWRARCPPQTFWSPSGGSSSTTNFTSLFRTRVLESSTKSSTRFCARRPTAWSYSTTSPRLNPQLSRNGSA